MEQSRLIEDTALPEDVFGSRSGVSKSQPTQPTGLKFAVAPTKQPSKVYFVCKRSFDVVASLFAIVVLAPVYLLLALAIKLEDGGSVVFTHERIGHHGQKLRLFKFRSMRQGAENLEDMLTPEELEEYYREYKLTYDPRITRIGKFIRKTSLDELPQFFNVLGGSLSLIGPRPIVEDELEYYQDTKEQLLSVKPGLTGYWQAYARNDVGYEDGSRQSMELYYCANRSIWLDIKIFFKTFEAVIFSKGK